jgi:hypothetical protein
MSQKKFEKQGMLLLWHEDSIFAGVSKTYESLPGECF